VETYTLPIEDVIMIKDDIENGIPNNEINKISLQIP